MGIFVRDLITCLRRKIMMKGCSPKTLGWVRAVLLLVWTLISASCSSARYVEFKDATGEKRWPFRYTAPWIAVLQSIFVILQTAGGEQRRAGRAINALLAFLFCALHIALAAPAYQQTDIWEDAGDSPNGRPKWMKLDVTSMFFAGLGVIEAFIIVATTLISQQKAACGKVENAE